jgi:ankyrin repeat protein/nucleoside phosphorylase
MPDEAKAVLKVFAKLGKAVFQREFSRRKREYRRTDVPNSREEPLRILVSWQPKYGPTQGLLHFQDMLDEFRPRFAAMTGICAGDRNALALGDLVVAERAYEYGAGKVILDANGIPRLKHDVETWQPDDTLVQYAGMFQDWRDDVAKLRRPRSKRQQREWLLNELLKPATPRVEDIPLTKRNRNAPRWRQLLDELTNGPASWLTPEGRLREPEAVEQLRKGPRPFPYRDPREVTQLVMVMGSGPAVRSDNPFPELRDPERKLIAVEMESAMFYHAVHSIPELGNRCLVVKGVSDYGDPDKDDSYRHYASEAPAIYVYHFIRAYVNSQLMPRLHAEDSPERIAGRNLTSGRIGAKELPVGVEATYPSLLIQIKSGNADNVRRLLQAGLSPNVVADDKTPLRIALEQLDGSTSMPLAPDDPRAAVVASLLQAGDPPRDLAREGHEAFDRGLVVRLVALLRAGLPLDVRDESGRTLLAKAMRRDDEAFDARSGTWHKSGKWVEGLLRDGNPVRAELAAWVLRWACRHGHLDLVKRLTQESLLGAPAAVSLPEEELTEDELPYWQAGVTGLHLAAGSSAAAAARIVEWLLKNGADPNAQDKYGNTPLMEAVLQRQTEIVRLLVDPRDRADVNLANKEGETALFFAVGEPRIVRLLLEAGAQPEDGPRTALHQAAYEFDHASMELLLDSRADVNVRDGYGRTPLMQMSSYWSNTELNLKKPARFRCFETLLHRGADVEARDSEGRTPLYWLAGRDDVQVLDALLKRHPDVNAADNAGRTPLMNCLVPEVADLLLRHGARLDQRDGLGHSALAWAVMFGRAEVAKRLRAAGAGTDGLGNAEVIHASQTGDANRLRTLLQAGNAPNARDGWGRTALHLAAMHGNVEAVQVLLARGADVDSRDEDNRTPPAAALWADSYLVKKDLDDLEKTVLTLLDGGASVHSVDKRGNSAAQVGAWWWYAPGLAARLLDECHEDVNREAVTLLMTAVERGRYDQSRYLIEQKGADVRAIDVQGRNALFRISGYQKDALAMARLLLDHGAEFDRADNTGVTPLVAAASSGHIDLVRLLLRYGADLNHQDNEGRTARYRAIQHGKTETANLLLQCERNPDLRSNL